LAKREKVQYEPSQVAHLAIGIAEVLERRDPNSGHASWSGQHSLSPVDAETFGEVFWDLFRQNVITLGVDGANPNYPFFRVSRLGKQILQNQSTYFFHDVSTYEAQIRAQVPAIDDVTMLYAKEAMQAFRSGCILSATVMLGVAAEHTFLSLIEIIDGSAKHKAAFAAVQKERSVLPKINRFWSIFQLQLAKVPAELKEDLETRFLGIQSLIRTFRNEAGHPTGTIIDREQTYVLLNLFIPYAKKMYQLRDYFALP
jgi:hypothetical protein